MEDEQKSLYEMISPYITAANLIIARAAGDTAKFHEQLRKAKEVLLGPLDTKVAVTPHDVVWQEDRSQNEALPCQERAFVQNATLHCLCPSQ